MEKQIAVYDNTVSAREYLSYIAEQAGGFAVIRRDGKLYIRQIGQNRIDFNINLFGDYKWGDKFKISKISYEDGIRDFKFGDETANTIYINQSNMYIVDEEQIETVYNKMKGFEAYSFEGETIIDPAYDIGDILIIDEKSVIYQGELEYATKFKANIKSKIQPKTQNESMQTKQDTTSRIKRIQSEINQIDGEIRQLVQETGEHEEKITQVEQDVDSIKQSINNTVDYKRETSGATEIHITDAGNQNILKFEVRGNKTYESNLFPRTNLYPRSGLQPNQKGG